MSKTITLSIIISQLLFIFLLPIFTQLIDYLHPIVLFVVWMWLTLFTCFVLIMIRKQSIKLPYWLGILFFVCYSICLIILLFLRPTEQSYENWNLTPFRTIDFYLSGNVSLFVSFYNLAANIGLFIPFGFLIISTTKKRLMHFVIPIVFISIIELLQFFTKRGSMDIDDLILNVLGVYIGYLLAPIIHRVVRVSKV